MPSLTPCDLASEPSTTSLTTRGVSPELKLIPSGLLTKYTVTKSSRRANSCSGFLLNVIPSLLSGGALGATSAASRAGDDCNEEDIGVLCAFSLSFASTGASGVTLS
eukprot:CAMPEP_0175278084 /NCGR_PEP_ID=MMETSP0093-20121207/49340_1 /TAXON_ID=311494 /ORGANISM="Alexandrium monilatum, Strain CCMP3105" /LENGTH=106 /DNA_ID=CAMNT_0016573057 /DNA_START=78 /DNA_END=398 /DNA_ORIENTATION=+